MTNERPRIYMLIGPQAAGKSTWRSKFIAQNAQKDNPRSIVTISSDDIIDDIAKSLGKTYSDVWKDSIAAADAQCREQFKNAVDQRHDIIVDRTNMTVKSRRQFLAGLPKEYIKIAVVFDNVQMDELYRRLAKRAKETGKFIPKSVIENTIARYEPPTKPEFDVIHYMSNGNHS